MIEAEGEVTMEGVEGEIEVMETEGGVRVEKSEVEEESME